MTHTKLRVILMLKDTVVETENMRTRPKVGCHVETTHAPLFKRGSLPFVTV